MTSNTEGVRIGPSSLVTLIAALLLAVLAMLCATSAHAQEAMAQREAESTTELYAVDSCGQRMLAGISAALQNGATSAADVYAGIDDIRDKAVSASDANITANAQLEGNTIALALTAPDGRALNAKITVAGGEASVSEWKLTGASQAASEVTLWQGSASATSAASADAGSTASSSSAASAGAGDAAAGSSADSSATPANSPDTDTDN